MRVQEQSQCITVLALVPSRMSRRYRASVPIKIGVGAQEAVLCTNSLSSTGCTICGEPPVWLANQCNVALLLPDATLEVSGVGAVRRKRDGIVELHLEWSLDAPSTQQLVAALQAVDVEPSSESKAAFLQAENALLHTEILHTEEQRRKGYQFLYLLVLAYFGYTVAPYRVFGQVSVEMMALYAIAGIWIALILLFHCARFFDYVGSALRRRSRLYKAMAANRGWLFAHDPYYFAKSVMPTAPTLDDLRAFKTEENDENEAVLHSVGFHFSTVAFQLVLQSFFVLGLFYFLSLLVRAYDLRLVAKIRIVPLEATGQHDLFKLDYFTVALCGGSLLLYLWLQFFGGKVMSFEKRVWESQRLSTRRPNPRFPSQAFFRAHPAIVIAGRAGVWLLVSVGVLSLGLFSPSVRSNAGLLIIHLLDARLVLGLAAVFLAIKALSVISHVREADREDKGAKPVRSR